MRARTERELREAEQARAALKAAERARLATLLESARGAAAAPGPEPAQPEKPAIRLTHRRTLYAACAIAALGGGATALLWPGAIVPTDRTGKVQAAPTAPLAAGPLRITYTLSGVPLGESTPSPATESGE